MDGASGNSVLKRSHVEKELFIKLKHTAERIRSGDLSLNPVTSEKPFREW